MVKSGMVIPAPTTSRRSLVGDLVAELDAGPATKMESTPGTTVRDGYDAINDRGRRRAPRSRVWHVDDLTSQVQRRSLIATAQDIERNFAVAAWAVRKHLDFVSSFTFRSKTGDDRVDEQVTRLVTTASKRENFDASNRHRRSRFIRILEARKCVDGDVGIYLLSDGTVQAIEADRIQNPTVNVPRDFNLDDFRHGVRVDRYGAARAYSVCNRERNGQYSPAAIIPERWMLMHACYERFDQVRGVSPITAALNTFRDVYENFDYALAKAKIQQLFGLVITSEGDSIDPKTEVQDEDSEHYKVNFGRGPFKLELEPGEDAKFLDANQPSSEFQQFTAIMIAIAIKSLDIPFSFFDESFTNFYGSRGGLIQYLKSCKSKRDDLVELLDAWLRWRLILYVLDGSLVLPAGMRVDDLKWEWRPDGVPWWDPGKEVKGQAMAIACGLTTFERASLESDGGDVYENIDANAAVLKYAQEKGYPLTLPGVNAFNPDITVAAGDSSNA